MYIIQLRGCITDMVRLFFCLPQTWWIRIFRCAHPIRKDQPSDILKKEKSVFRLKRSAKDCGMAHWFVRAKSPKRRKVPKESTQGFLRTGKRDIRREMSGRMRERYERAYERAEKLICAQGRGFAKKLAKAKRRRGLFVERKAMPVRELQNFIKDG